jgi:hypothetical protein
MVKVEVRKAAVPLLGFLCVALVLALLIPSSSQAQVLYGSIVGEVKDASGASIPGASVAVTNKGTGLVRQIMTDEAGRFNLTDLTTGSYSVKISQQGFKTFEQAEVTVSINSVSRIEVAMEIGSIGDTVTVDAEPPKLQTETSEVAVGVVANELQNLPVPLGRNYQQVYRMLPGFSPPQNSHSIPTNPARSLEFTVNGTSDNQNNTRIDGVSTTHVQLPHVASYVPTLESIQEVNVVTSSFDAEQGLAGGAAINVQTRSGTNDIHGSAFEYHTDSHLKAWPMLFSDADLNTGTKPKQVYNEYGGTVGGPIKKNRAFYFVSYEGTADRRNYQSFATVPLPSMLTGDLQASTTPIYDPLSGDLATGAGRTQFKVGPGDANYALCNTATNPECLNIIPASRISPIAKKIIPFFAAPNINRESRNYFVSGPWLFDRKQVDSKVDYNVNAKFNLIGTFGMLHYNSVNPTVYGEAGGGAGMGGSNPGKGHGNTYRLTVMGTYTFSPNFLVDAHYGYARQGTSSEQPGLGKNIGLETFGIPGTNGTRAFESGWPEFDIENYNTIGTPNNFMPYYRHDPQSQYVVNVTWIKNKHNIRFGGDVYRQGLNQTQAEFASGGYGAQGGFHFSRGMTQRCVDVDPSTGNCDEVSSASRYNSVAAFLLGTSDSAGRTLQVPDEYHIRAWLFSMYARDRWAISPKLTLDIGIRWEYFPVPTRPDRGIESYDPATNQVSLCGFGSIPGDCGINASKKRFSPRVGLAYRITDKLVFRAGYGITNDPYEAFEPLRANYPLLIQVRRESPDGLTPATTLAQGIPTINVPENGNGVLNIPGDYVFQGLPKDLNRGYIQSWNIALQRELPMGFTAQAAYVATRSVRTLGLVDINAGQIIGAGEEGRPLLSKFGRSAATIFLQPVGTGHYDSLQAQLQRRFAAGLGLTINYTYGKATSPNENSDWTPNVQAVSYMGKNRSLTSTDRTHNMGITNVWQLPFGTGRKFLNSNGFLSQLLGGWQVNNMLSIMSGTPFGVYGDGTSLNLPGSNQTADQIKPTVQKLGGTGTGVPYYDPSAFADVTAARFGNTGYNYLRAPGLFNWDFGMFREFGFTERYRLQFRMEAFNFTNTPHLGTPDNYVGDGSDFMTITGTNNLGREGIDERQFRFGLRLIF